MNARDAELVKALDASGKRHPPPWLRDRAMQQASAALLRMPKHARWTFRIRCSGMLHRVVLSRDRVDLPDHDLSDELVLWTLGGKAVPSQCLCLAARAEILREGSAYSIASAAFWHSNDWRILNKADAVALPGRLARAFELGAWVKLCNAEDARRHLRRKRGTPLARRKAR